MSEYPKPRLTMIGPDKGDGSLERTQRAAVTLGVSGACHFVGRVEESEVAVRLAKGEIFLNIEDGKDALRVPPDDAVAMAEAVRRLHTEPGLAGTLSRNGRNNVAQFDWPCVLPEWERLLESVAGSGESRD